MVDFNINVKIDPSSASAGSAAVKAELNSIAATADRLRGLIKEAFIFAGIGYGVTALKNLADQYTNVQNRVRLATSSQAELAAVMDRIFNISSDTGTKLDTVVNTYQKLNMATKNLGLSQDETLKMTNTLTQAAILSATGTSRMAFGIQEVVLGMGQANLNGRELRAIINDVPYVARMIVDELNKTNPGINYTTANLKELAKQGVLTPKLLADAIHDGAEKTASDFDKLNPTITRALNSLQTGIVKYIGQLNASTGVQGNVATAINTLAHNLDTLGKGLLALSVIFAVNYATQAVPAAILATKAFTVALLGNPLVALGYALLQLIALLVVFSNDIYVLGDGVTTLGDVFKQMCSDTVDYFKDLFKFISTGFSNLAPEAAAAWTEVRNKARTGLGMDPVDNTALNDIQPNPTPTFGNGSSMSLADRAHIRGLFRQAQDAVNKANGAVDLTAPGIATKNNMEKPLDTYANIVAKLTAESKMPFSEAGAHDQKLQIMQQELDIASKLKEAELSPEQKATIEPLLKEIAARKELQQLYDKIAGPQEALMKGQSDLNILYAQGAISIDQYNDELQKLQLASLKTRKDLGSGLQAGMIEIAQKFSDVATLASTTLVDAFSNGENALLKFAQTGKLSMTDMVNSMITDIERLLIRMEITAPIANYIGSMMGGLNGGSTSGGAGIFGALGSAFKWGASFFADGDILNSPTMLGFSNGKVNIGGEAGTEAVMPLKRTSSGALGVVASGGGGVTNITNNITTNVTGSNGGASDNAQLAEMVSNKMQVKVQQTMTDFTRKQQRSGGMLNPGVTIT